MCAGGRCIVAVLLLYWLLYRLYQLYRAVLLYLLYRILIRGSTATKTRALACTAVCMVDPKPRVRHGPPRPTGMWVRGGVLTIFKSAILGSTSWP